MKRASSSSDESSKKKYRKDDDLENDKVPSDDEKYVPYVPLKDRRRKEVRRSGL